MLEVVGELGVEIRVVLGRVVGRLDREDQRHQGLGDIAPAIDAEMAALVRPAAKGVGAASGLSGALRDTESRVSSPRRHGYSKRLRATARKARILSGSLSPGRRSTPEETSTAVAPEIRTASGSSSAVEPARQHPRQPPVAAGDQLPIEGEPVAAGQRIGAARRLGVEQQHVGRVFVARGGERRPPGRRSRSPS